MITHQTPFDQWVEEAPFRHLGVFAIMLLAVVAFCTGGCTPDQHYQCDKYVIRTDVVYDHYRDGSNTKRTTLTEVCVHSTLETKW